MRVLAFGASNSKQSINKIIAVAVANLIPNAEVEVIDLNDFDLPIYSIDIENEHGIPNDAKRFYNLISTVDVIVISFAEHNGNYSVAYKNLFDWTTRFERKIFQNKAMILLATSPGQGGGARVLKLAADAAPTFAGNVIGTLSIPSFNENFDSSTNSFINQEVLSKVMTLMEGLNEDTLANNP